MKEKAVFLTAQWEYLVMLNYPVPPEIIIPYLPKGTELDLFQGKALVSVVGFLFNNTKVFGLQWPFHTISKSQSSLLCEAIQREGMETWRGIHQ